MSAPTSFRQVDGFDVHCLYTENDFLRKENQRLRIAHLRRMLSSLPGAVERMKWFSAHTEAEYERKKWRRRDQFTRFGKAINVEIARLRGEG